MHRAAAKELASSTPAQVLDQANAEGFWRAHKLETSRAKPGALGNWFDQHREFGFPRVVRLLADGHNQFIKNAFKQLAQLRGVNWIGLIQTSEGVEVITPTNGKVGRNSTDDNLWPLGMWPYEQPDADKTARQRRMLTQFAWDRETKSWKKRPHSHNRDSYQRIWPRELTEPNENHYLRNRAINNQRSVDSNNEEWSDDTSYDPTEFNELEVEYAPKPNWRALDRVNRGTTKDVSVAIHFVHKFSSL